MLIKTSDGIRLAIIADRQPGKIQGDGVQLRRPRGHRWEAARPSADARLRRVPGIAIIFASGIFWALAMQEALTLLTAGNPALAAICREHGVRRLDLFGSRARGTARDDADVDLLVEIEAPTPAAYARAWFALKEQLEALFGRPVDLLTTGSLENPYLRQRAVAERITLFDAGSC